MFKIIFTAALVCAAVSARAAEPEMPSGVTCADVRRYVAHYGRAGAKALALLKGYSQRQISEAEKCLK